MILTYILIVRRIHEIKNNRQVPDYHSQGNRDRLKLSKHDVIEWKFEKGLIVVEPVQNPFQP